MYTMVLMMAASSAGESPDFLFRKSAPAAAAAPAGCTGVPAGCTGMPAGCTGVVVVTSVGCTGCRGIPAGCTGIPAGCTGIPAGCTGCMGTPAGCHGTAHEKESTSRGGFLGIRARLFGGGKTSKPASTGTGCLGVAPACCPPPAPACCPPPAPVACCPPVAAPCCGTVMGTVMMPGVPMSKPMTMPEVKKDEPKKDEPKKDEPKKGNEL